jgi:hypothetical protein
MLEELTTEKFTNMDVKEFAKYLDLINFINEQIDEFEKQLAQGQ